MNGTKQNHLRNLDRPKPSSQSPNPQTTSIIFMGTPEFAVPSLKKISDDGYRIVGVFTNPDKPFGRDQKLRLSPVKAAAKKLGLPVFQPNRLRHPRWIRKIKKLKPDLIIVAAYGHILPKSILDIPSHGPINVHASLLPKYRGASPIQTAILKGETITGITIMLMDEGMDTGPILAQQEQPIPSNWDSEKLHDALSILGADLLSKTLPDWLAGKVKPIPQNDRHATYAKMIKKEDGLIDWNQESTTIINKVRAFNPWPGAFSFLNGKMIKLISVERSKGNSKDRPGRLFVENDSLSVATKTSPLKINRLQLAGGKPQTGNEFIRGHKIMIGQILKSL